MSIRLFRRATQVDPATQQRPSLALLTVTRVVPSQMALSQSWHRHAAQHPRAATKGGKPQEHQHGHVCLVEVRDDLPNGRGLALTRDVEPNEVVLTLPASLLINTRTLADKFEPGVLPRPNRPGKLTGIQVLCVYLCRPDLHDADGQAFVASLPTSFASHPVMWALDEAEFSQLLLASLPDETAARVANIVTKLEADWRAIAAYCRETTTTAPSRPDFIHAWLCINTRSVYYSLGLPRDDNLTLAPLLDMANHTCQADRIATVTILGSSPSSTSLAPIKGAGSIELRLPSGGQRGDEVCIAYGAHDDSRLFAEYGFHLGRDEGPLLNPHAAVDVTTALERRLAALSEREGSWREETLRQTGYWGEWTIDAEGPSWRTEMACRIASAHTDEDRRRFDLVVAGRVSIISRDNEEEARRLLDEVCQEAKISLEVKLRRLPTSVVGEDAQASVKLVSTLLKSQVAILSRNCNR